MTDLSRQIEALHREALAALVERADSRYRIDDLVATRGAVLGVRVPEIRKLAKVLRKQHRALPLEDALNLLDLCCRSGGREEILFGIFFLTTFRQHLSSALWCRFDAWLEAVDNWETCDQLALVAGGLVAADLSLVDDLVALAGAADLWRRRFAVAVSTDLNHKGRSHPGETFRILDKVLEDPEVMVQKAVAWALREVSKKEPRATFDFLQPRLERCSARVRREGTSKLPDDLRARLQGQGLAQE